MMKFLKITENKVTNKVVGGLKIDENREESTFFVSKKWEMLELLEFTFSVFD